MVGRVEKVTPGHGLQFRHSGVFDLDRLYSEISGWIGDHDYDFQEKEHSDKMKDKGKEIKYVFTGDKVVIDYINFHIEVVIGLTEVNPVSDNLIKGNAKITLHSRAELDYKNEWSQNAISDFFFKIYNNHIIKNKILEKTGVLYDETTELWDLIKDVLDFNR